MPLTPLDPALFPALYDNLPVVKDAAYWKDRYEDLLSKILTVVQSPHTPMTKIAILEDTIREQYRNNR